MPKKLAYLGPPGTFSEEAALLYDRTAELLPMASFRAVASAVEAGMADEGIVAIENSIEGSVTDVLDLLIHDSHLSIYTEVVLPINNQLLVKPGQAVKKGQPLAILEAMKMEHTLAAPGDATIASVEVGQGDQVGDGAVVVRFEAEEAA